MSSRVTNISERAMYRSVWEWLLAARDILLISPKRPDGDSLGSICGLCEALHAVGKEAVLYCPDPIPPTFDLLPNVRKVRSEKSEVRSQKFDAIVVVDAGDLEFAGIAEELPAWKAGGGQLIVIDHHATNTRYGDVNCVVTGAASTTEVITRMLRECRIPMTAATLMAAGARIAPMLRAVYRSKPIDALRLWGRAFERLRVHPTWDIATTVLIPEDFQECADGAERAEGLSNFLQAVLPARAILVLKDSGSGIVRGSLRTQRDDTDLGRLAEAFGGGGHRKAAGFGIPGTIVQNGERWKVV